MCGLGAYCVFFCVFCVSYCVMLYGVCLFGLFVCVMWLRVLRVVSDVLSYGLSSVLFVCVRAVAHLCVL